MTSHLVWFFAMFNQKTNKAYFRGKKRHVISS